MKSAGAEGKGTVFLIADTQIKEECFLEDIDNLLNSGEVPNLFAVDEKQEKIEVCVILHLFKHFILSNSIRIHHRAYCFSVSLKYFQAYHKESLKS